MKEGTRVLVGLGAGLALGLIIAASHNATMLGAADLIVPVGTTLDLAQKPRFVDAPAVADTGAGTAPIVDMGVFEAPNTLYSSFCAADAMLATPCPCANFGQLGRGCADSDGF